MTLQKTISPIDNSVYVERELANSSQVEKVLSNAKAAQLDWAKMSIRDKANIMQRFVEYFEKEKTSIAEEITKQMGRPIAYSPGEISGLIERTNYMVSIAEDALKDIEVEQKAGFKRYIAQEPVGVVFVIAPWNYPYLTAVNAIVPALMAGNSVILKHSSQTPLCAERFFEAFQYAGLPEHVFQFLHLSHDATAELIQDDRVNFVAFTGSVSGGRSVQQSASNRFIGVGLELGGKDPAYVRQDANVKFAAENLADGAFFNSGQSCCGIERIYVHEAVYDKFVEQLVSEVKKLKLGNPLDKKTTLGPVVKSSAAQFVQAQVDEAVSQGAKNLLANLSSDLTDVYLTPKILVGVNHDMRIMTEESFGPVVGVMKVKDDKEAIKLMNDSEYGLTASIWTQDENAAITIGEQVEAGTWFMNRCDYLDPALVWTGVKNSGRGCALSVLGYQQFVQPKSYHLRHI